MKHSLSVTICGIDELERHAEPNITHLIIISNPGPTPSIPSSFHGKSLHLQFGDVISDNDAKQCHTIAPKHSDVEAALNFLSKSQNPISLLVCCTYGASRSPALAYVILADHLGLEHEQTAFDVILKSRPEAVPNKLIVKLGDQILKRNGALLAPLKTHYRQINKALGLE